MKLLQSALFCLVAIVIGDDDSGWSLAEDPLVAVHPCNGSTDIQLMYEPGRSPEEENQYNLYIHKKFPKNTIIKLKFDKGATVTLSNQTFARIYVEKSDEHVFRIRFFKSNEGILFNVQGCALGVVPYIKSVNINTKEYCGEPRKGFLDSYIEGSKIQAKSSCVKNKQNEEKCGRVQALVTPLSADGVAQRNSWPWHVAVYLFKKQGESRNKGTYTERYVCGATLISNYHVLTAAHCVVTVHKGTPLPPEQISVALGKNDLSYTFENGAVLKEIEKNIPHEDFEVKSYSNDIALLKMKTEVTFSVYIQPACIWYENAHKDIASDPIVGTFAGWGIDNTDTLSGKLNQAEIPIVSNEICIRNHPTFYSIYLTADKFCAGNLEGAIACNGDSGGGLHVFIPDKRSDNAGTGAWYIRGIVSVSVANANGTCNLDNYTLLTDIDKHREWISSHM